MGDYSLKFKKLVPVTFTPVDSSKQDEQHTLAASGENRFMCPVTFKTFGRATKALIRAIRAQQLAARQAAVSASTTALRTTSQRLRRHAYRLQRRHPETDKI